MGVDVGGTFTDVVAVEDGVVSHFKVPTSAADPAVAVLDALGRVETERVVHGTTVATNTLLTRTGARVGLVATEGFRDVLEIARQNRPSLYDREQRRPDPLVPRRLRLEVEERLGPKGEVLLPLARRTLLAVGEGLRATAVEAVAVCLLHSYANRCHEDEVVEHLRDFLGVPVVGSSDVAPEFREFERTSTTVLTAYLRPAVEGYLTRLVDSIDAPLDVMSSSGGLLPAHLAHGNAAALLLSGPAGGAHAGAAIAAATGFPDAISFDVGGTSTDVCLIREGAPEWTADHSVEGYPCRLPAIDLHTVGAGGGSIGWVDAGGALRVGPKSAGADPGPACYGLGSEMATLTDAHLVLGRLPAALPALGRTLDVDRSRRAIGDLALGARLTGREAALGMLRVAEAAIVRALRRVSVERGIDPVGLPLVAFGGAGPLHAAGLSAALGAPLAIVPARAGVLSALGLLLAPERRDVSVSVMAPVEEEHTWTSAAREASDRAMRAWGRVGGGSVALVAECRYRGQSHELPVPVDEAHPSALRGAFDGEHQRRNGFARPDALVEVVVVRARIEGAPPLVLADLPAHPEGPAPSPISTRDADWGEGPVATPCYRRNHLGAGFSFPGPSVVEDEDTTIAVPPGVRAEVDGMGSILLRWQT